MKHLYHKVKTYKYIIHYSINWFSTVFSLIFCFLFFKKELCSPILQTPTHQNIKQKVLLIRNKNVGNRYLWGYLSLSGCNIYYYLIYHRVSSPLIYIYIYSVSRQSVPEQRIRKGDGYSIAHRAEINHDKRPCASLNLSVKAATPKNVHHRKHKKQFIEVSWKEKR